MSTNPANKLPNILPRVDQKKISPVILPIPFSGKCCPCNLIANGESVPSNKLGMKNKIIAEIIGPLTIERLYPRDGSKNRDRRLA